MQQSNHFPTLTRLMGSYRQLGRAVARLLSKFNWTTVSFFHHDYAESKSLGHSDCYHTLAGVNKNLNKSNLSNSNSHFVYDQYDVTKEQIIEQLKELKAVSRSKLVYYFFYYL